MAIGRLFCYRVVIRLFRLKVKGTEKQPEAYRMHIHVAIPQSRNLSYEHTERQFYKKTKAAALKMDCTIAMSDTGVKMYSIKLNRRPSRAICVTIDLNW